MSKLKPFRVLNNSSATLLYNIVAGSLPLFSYLPYILTYIAPISYISYFDCGYLTCLLS